MLPAQDLQSLPSFNQVLQPDQHRTILPNLSYPSRPIAHIPWSGSSAPVFSKTVPPELTVATSTNIPVPTAGTICFDTSSVPDAFYGLSVFIRNNLSMIVRKLKLVKQKMFGRRTTTLPVTASV